MPDFERKVTVGVDAETAFNFLAAFTFGTAVASTIGKGMIDITVVTSTVIFGGLMGAIVWDLITWYVGLPTSSSHALIGAYAGAAVAKAGTAAIVTAGWTKTLIFIVLAPLIGFALGFLFMVLIMWIMRPFAPSRVDRYFRKLQLLSAAMYSLGHGANDAQKTMGISAGALFAAGYISEFRIPFWVEMAAYSAIALGTLSGGWRIIHTMGSKITKPQPVGGFAAETSAATALMIATVTGVPVSTTHAITGAIVRVRLVPDEVVAAPARQLGMWHGDAAAADRADQWRCPPGRQPLAHLRPVPRPRCRDGA